MVNSVMVRMFVHNLLVHTVLLKVNSEVILTKLFIRFRSFC